MSKGTQYQEPGSLIPTQAQIRAVGITDFYHMIIEALSIHNNDIIIASKER